MRTLLTSFAVVCAAAIATACSETPEPEYPLAGAGGAYPQGGYGASAGQPPVDPGTGASGQGAAGGPPASAGNQATGLPLVLMPPQIMQGMATQETAGMRADGPALAANFQQGQVYEQPLTLQPGRCYTVVGIGIGITELDIELVLHQPPAPEYVAAIDSTTGPRAVLGPSPNCFKNPLPIAAPAMVRMRATGGNGLGAAQVFVK